ncbi:MAG: hypothetical protein KKB50_18280 [Planctomycetes bacterium]|nr:hypothetical protein [Planctomycetota bacterium]
MLVLLFVTAVFLTLLAAGCAATCRPAWYVPTSIDHARLKADEQALMNTLDEIGGALNRGRTIDLELTEEQLNRWITARAKMLPETELAMLADWRHPQLSFLSGGRVRVAATVNRVGLSLVLSGICRLKLAGDELLVQVEAVHVGHIPVPAGWLAQSLRPAAQRGKLGTRRVAGSAIAFENDWTWPNGKPRFRVLKLSVGDTLARLTLAPVRRTH